MVFALAACGGESGNEGEGGTPGGESVELTLTCNGTDFGNDTRSAKRFKELIEAETDGRITVKIINNDQLAGGNMTAPSSCSPAAARISTSTPPPSSPASPPRPWSAPCPGCSPITRGRGRLLRRRRRVHDRAAERQGRHLPRRRPQRLQAHHQQQAPHRAARGPRRPQDSHPRRRLLHGLLLRLRRPLPRP